MPFRFHPVASRLLACYLSYWLAAPMALANDPASQQLREQQQTGQQLEQQQRLERWLRAPSAVRNGAPSSAEPGDGHCWAVSGVRLAGNHLLSTQALAPTVQALVAPCMGVADINRLLKAITQRYVQAGYPASRPYLQHPPAQGDALDILIIEGFVESVELDVERPLSLHSAFPNMLGQPVYLPDLEQGLDQLNRLRAYELSADLLPGEMQGGTRVLLQSRQVDSRWHLDSRFDNRGSPLTGRYRLNLTLGVDSPLGLNDDLRLSLATTVIDAPGRSQGVSAYYSIPYGPWTFTLNASQLSYNAPLPQSVQRSSGSSQYQGVSVERMLWRNQHGMLSASARLDRKQLVNRTGGALVQLQSPTLTSVEAGLNLLWLDNGVWNTYVGVAQGTGWLGATQPARRADAPPPGFSQVPRQPAAPASGAGEPAVALAERACPAVQQPGPARSRADAAQRRLGRARLSPTHLQRRQCRRLAQHLEPTSATGLDRTCPGASLPGSGHRLATPGAALPLAAPGRGRGRR